MMAEQKEGNIDAMLACASAIPAVGRDALRVGWAAVTALKAHRASANPLGEHLPGAASASPLPGKKLPPRYLTIRLGHNLLRLRDPVLNVLTSAGCANFAQANALLNTFARPAFGDQNPPAVRAGETLSAVGAKHDDFKGEVPSYDVTLPLKVIDRQPNYLLVTLVDTVSGKGVGRQYAIVAHHPVPLTAASGPAAPIPAAAGTLAPATSIPAAGGALAPAASIPAAGSTLAPAPPVPDRFAASRTLYEGLHPPVTALMLQLEKATLRAAGRTLPPLTHPLTSFMPLPVFIDQRYDTRYLNFCNMVANYPGARQFYLHGLTQSRKSVPSGYDQLKATLPYFTHEAQLARRYAHDLIEEFPSDRAFCLGGDGTSCQLIQRYLAQALRTNDRHILHQAGIRLGWHLAKINHYLNQYAHAIHFASRYPAVSSADNAHLALGFAHPADRARRCYIMVDNFITHHFRHVTK